MRYACLEKSSTDQWKCDPSSENYTCKAATSPVIFGLCRWQFLLQIKDPDDILRKPCVLSILKLVRAPYGAGGEYRAPILQPSAVLQMLSETLLNVMTFA
jgi:hypothetical protein